MVNPQALKRLGIFFAQMKNDGFVKRFLLTTEIAENTEK
jgi:hypothetical protein